MQPVKQAARFAKEVRAAAERGDYALAESLALSLAPGKETELTRFRERMEVYEQARESQDWRRALRALADARDAAVAAGLPELEGVVTHRLFDIVKLQQEVRKA